jgi:hypothetical protein
MKSASSAWADGAIPSPSPVKGTGTPKAIDASDRALTGSFQMIFKCHPQMGSHSPTLQYLTRATIGPLRKCEMGCKTA